MSKNNKGKKGKQQEVVEEPTELDTLNSNEVY